MKLFILAMVVTVTYFYVMENLFNSTSYARASSSTSSTNNSSSYQVDDEIMTITVTIDGEVKNPGKYTLNEGEYLSGLIEKAGGLKDTADGSAFHQGVILEKGQNYYIAPVTDEKKVSLNEAGLDELQTLSGIGTTYANRIIEYRSQIGVFQRIEQLKNIVGIGETIFNKNKDKVCL